VRNGDDQFVEYHRAARNQIEVAVGNGVERPGIDSDHWLLPSGGISCAILTYIFPRCRDKNLRRKAAGWSLLWEARLEPTLQRPKRGVHGLLDTRGRDCVASSLSGTVRIPLRCQTALI
jgi:hypothetical protein